MSTFELTVLGSITFLRCLRRYVRNGPVRIQDEIDSFYAYLFVLACHWVGLQPWFKRAAIRVPEPVAGLGYAVLMSCVLVLAPGSNNAFIYFQF